MARDEEFARVLRHSVFHATLVHGAVPVWMPRLEPEVMQEIEGKHLTFGQACGAGRLHRRADRRFRAVVVGRWLERMEHEPSRSWLP
jgi:hypothetical protein